MEIENAPKITNSHPCPSHPRTSIISLTVLALLQYEETVKAPHSHQVFLGT
jgi:hypothetical protein